MKTSMDPYRALKMEQAGLALAPAILEHLRSSKIADLCYAIKLRTKTEEKLLEKKARKRHEKPNYELHDITDVVGLRLVALFRADMIDLLEGCLKAMLHDNGISPNPFSKATPEEIIFYKGNSAFDEMSTSVRDVTKKVCGSACTVTEKNSREGYSSVHIVGRLGSTLKFEHGPPPFSLPIEIQIRTVFEDAWGEIDHKHGYVIRTGKQSGRPIQNPDSVLTHLKNLKRFTDACMEYAEAIRHEAIRTETATDTVPSKVISVEADDEILGRFATLEVPPERVDEYVEARALKIAALGDDQDAAVFDRQKCLEAAEVFREIADGVENERLLENSPGLRLYYYYVRMNEALCSISINDREHIQKALTIYRNLEVKYPQFPLLRMRAGQALGKLGNYDDALTRLQEAGEMADRIQTPHSTPPAQSWPDELPQGDFLHVVRTQPKLTGYYLWHQILNLPKEDYRAKAALFLEASKATKKGLMHLDGDQKQVSAYRNNLLYYAVGYKYCASKLDAPWVFPEEAVDAEIADHVSFFDSKSQDEAVRPIRTLDTLMHAYVLTGRTAEAASAAAELKARVLTTPPEEMASDLALRYIRSAERVSSGQPLEML